MQTANIGRADIIARNGEHLALFLADRGIGIIEQNGKKVFDPARLAAWLAAV
jgi:hypothetical protein